MDLPERIGLTYDLRADYEGQGLSEEELAEFDRADTIEALERALAELDVATERIGNLGALARRLCAGERWDLVFNIAEGRFGVGREAQVPALLDAWRVPYTFSDPLVCALTLHKGTTKRVLRDHGLPTPDFALVEGEADLARLALPYPLFAKPVAEGTSKGVDERSVVRTPAALAETCSRLLERHRQAVLVERFLPGRELTVGIVGTGARARSVGALEVVLLAGADREAYTFRNKEECESLVEYRVARDPLAAECERLSLAAWRALGCRDGGRVDLRCDEHGRPQVLELNPLPGMHPAHSDLPILWTMQGGSYVELVGSIVRSAAERLAPALTGPCAS